MTKTMIVPVRVSTKKKRLLLIASPHNTMLSHVEATNSMRKRVPPSVSAAISAEKWRRVCSILREGDGGWGRILLWRGYQDRKKRQQLQKQPFNI